MGCGSCGGGGNTQSYPYMTAQHNNLQLAQQPENCSLTAEVLTKWLNILTCIRTQNKGYLVGLEGFTMNSLVGVVQSAINYPNNYCYYQPNLENFQTNILPLIIENVPECVS